MADASSALDSESDASAEASDCDSLVVVPSSLADSVEAGEASDDDDSTSAVPTLLLLAISTTLLLASSVGAAVVSTELLLCAAAVVDDDADSAGVASSEEVAETVRWADEDAEAVVAASSSEDASVAAPLRLCAAFELDGAAAALSPLATGPSCDESAKASAIPPSRAKRRYPASATFTCGTSRASKGRDSDASDLACPVALQHMSSRQHNTTTTTATLNR